MTLTLPPDLQAAIQQQLASGQYDSQEEVIREALQALASRDQEVAAIAEGIADMEAERVRPVVEFEREFRQRHGIEDD